MPTIECHVKKFRRARQLTQEELARRVGVTRQTINAIEQGKYQPTLYLAYRCAKFFRVDVNKLFIFKD